MADGKPGDDREADDVSSDEHVFTPETDRLIRDIPTMSYRFDLNPFMFSDPPSVQADRWQNTKRRGALVALFDRLRRRHRPSGE